MVAHSEQSSPPGPTNQSILNASSFPRPDQARPDRVYQNKIMRRKSRDEERQRYMTTHLQPGDLSCASEPLPRRSLPPFVSSSSTKSWGLIVMCTTLRVSWLNLESVEMGVRYCQDVPGLHSLPFSGALSSSSFPNDISLIELGLEGFGSHSIHKVSTSVLFSESGATLAYRLSIPLILALSACIRSG